MTRVQFRRSGKKKGLLLKNVKNLKNFSAPSWKMKLIIFNVVGDYLLLNLDTFNV